MINNQKKAAVLMLCIVVLAVFTSTGCGAKLEQHAADLRRTFLYALYFRMYTNGRNVATEFSEDGIVADTLINPRKYAKKEIVFLEDPPTSALDENQIVVYPSLSTYVTLDRLNEFLLGHRIGDYGGTGEEARRVEVSDILNADNRDIFIDMALWIDREYPYDYLVIFEGFNGFK